tara:strand:- start:1051 stop:1230 length:180 start_codon:yes stop_codon:yes gene_type:complete
MKDRRSSLWGGAGMRQSLALKFQPKRLPGQIGLGSTVAQTTPNRETRLDGNIYFELYGP